MSQNTETTSNESELLREFAQGAPSQEEQEREYLELIIEQEQAKDE